VGSGAGGRQRGHRDCGEGGCGWAGSVPQATKAIPITASAHKERYGAGCCWMSAYSVPSPNQCHHCVVQKRSAANVQSVSTWLAVSILVASSWI
jgi:hypothetical protein